jgi:hypothetical protein
MDELTQAFFGANVVLVVVELYLMMKIYWIPKSF